ncbi:DUF4843 domain-containing protein [Prevotella sp. KH2C16]|uniref:DUF4843 domain-containing protein n=1 Tax=Prevotella sp. KH2C16 TaxID=1855325 RepID=UPI0008EEA2C5|nr:DUF4843 domain-containing protein [Prevotella sp. KH2C16]SFF87960.1 protein of unknown function [Prevotella sp. KH2C16]
MKKLIYILSSVVLLVLFNACQEEDLQLWGNEHHIYFEKFYKDAAAPGKERAETTDASFFFEKDDVKSIDVKLVVNMTGRLLDNDMPFRLKVVEEDGMTTATKDEYEIQDRYVFRAHNVNDTAKNQRDTISVKMFRTNRIEQLGEGEYLKLTLELIPEGALLLGQTERTRAVIHLMKDAIKPEWWDAEITNNLFGNYTPRKYKLFLLNIDGAATLNAEMLRTAPYKAIALVRKYKQWINEHPDEAKEADGTPITVNV